MTNKTNKSNNFMFDHVLVRVKFPEQKTNKSYEYYSTKLVKKGDSVVVDSAGILQVAKIVDVLPPTEKSYPGTLKFVIDVVDHVTIQEQKRLDRCLMNAKQEADRIAESLENMIDDIPTDLIIAALNYYGITYNKPELKKLRERHQALYKANKEVSVVQAKIRESGFMAGDY